VEYLGNFTDPSQHYAFTTYDQAPVHGGPLTVADVLLANLLSLRLGWHDVIPLFAAASTPATELRRALDAALGEARSLPPLEDCDDTQVTMPMLARTNEISGLALADRKPNPGARSQCRSAAPAHAQRAAGRLDGEKVLRRPVGIRCPQEVAR
jgi:hypothetical protein